MKFQNILFPAGVSFSKNSGFNRTTEVNSAIKIFHLFSDSYREFQETKKEKPEDFSFSVDSTDTLSNFIDALLKLLEIP